MIVFQTKNTNTGQAFLVKKGTAPKSAFGDIADKNLFSLDRTKYQPVEIKEETLSTETPKVDGRKITLFGVILLDGYRSALVSNPEVKSGEASTRWVKPGDRIAQLNVEQISKDSIVLSGEGKKYRVDLYDQKNKQRSGVAAVSPAAEPTVVMTQPAPKAPPKTVEPQKETQPPDETFEMIKTPFGMIKRKKQP